MHRNWGVKMKDQRDLHQVLLEGQLKFKVPEPSLRYRVAQWIEDHIQAIAIAVTSISAVTAISLVIQGAKQCG